MGKVSRRLAKDKVAGFADQAIVSGGNFVTIAVTAHVLSLTDQGALTYVLASYMALLLLNTASIFQGAAVRAPAQDGRTYEIALARLQVIQAVGLSAAVGLLWFMGDGLPNSWTGAEEAALIVGFLIAQQLADFSRRSAYVFWSATRAFLFSVTLYPTRVVTLLALHPDTLSQVLAIMLATALVPAGFAAVTAFQMHGKVGEWIESVVEHLGYSKLFLVSAPLGWLWSFLPIFLLGAFDGKEMAAVLGSIRSISNVANVLMEQLETQLGADWARIHYRSGRIELERKEATLYRLGLVLWMAGLTTVLLFGQDLVKLLLGERYAPYWRVLEFVWLAYGLYFVARVYAIKYRTIGNNQVEVVGSGCGAVTALISGLLLIPSYGLYGAAASYVAISAALVGAQAYQVRKGGKR